MFVILGLAPASTLLINSLFLITLLFDKYLNVHHVFKRANLLELITLGNVPNNVLTTSVRPYSTA